MKIFGSVLTVMVLGIIGLIGTIIASLSRNAEFYGPLVPIITIGVIVMVILAIYGQLKKKVPKISSIVFVSLALMAVMSFEGYQAYLNSLEVVSSQDTDLSEYRPFVENSKAVSLDEEASLTLEDHLPDLDGATALYPVYAAFVQAVYPEKEYPLHGSEVVSSQTSEAFDRLVRGEADIVFMAHPSEKQMEMAVNQGAELSLTPIGREAFVFFVHTNNPVEELSLEEIRKIYAGEFTNWTEVGGKDEEIQAFQRPEGSGSQSALLSVMDGKPLMDPPSEDIVSGMGGIIRETTSYRNRTNAIGFSFRHFSQDMVENGKIKNVAVEGIMPTKENIQNETYPIINQFYAITAGSDNPHIQAFIDWMQSAQGQSIVDQTGYVPLE